jgi:hypothetical protein
MGSTTIQDYFRSEILGYPDANGNPTQTPVPIFAGGKTSIEVKELDQGEIAAIGDVFDTLYGQMYNVSPEIAATILPQRQAVIKWGAVAKALFPDQRSITYPGEAGTIGVDMLTPNLLMYNNVTASTTAGQKDYCGYIDKAGWSAANSLTSTVTGYRGRNWDIKMFKGEVCPILGSVTAATGTSGATTSATVNNLYQSNDASNTYSFTVLLQNGILEENSSPSIESFYIKTSSTAKYAPWNVSPVIDQPIETGRPLYQYKTLGQIPLWHNFGTFLGAMPGRTGISTLPLLGITFYEYNMFDGPGGSGVW